MQTLQSSLFVRLFLVILASPGVLYVTGCDTDFSPSADLLGGPGAPGFGATPGGLQDMDLARALIDAGQVPPAAAFTVEGLLSEYDLPLPGVASEDLLSLNAAVGIAPDFSGSPAAWVQVGLASNIDPEAFKRASLTLVFCVDVSSSMGWDYSEHGSQYTRPGRIARDLLLDLSQQLRNDDRAAMVTFDSDARMLLGLVSGRDPSVTQTIEGLCDGGSTYMEKGLQLALEQACEALDGRTDEVRIVLITDAQPNVGSTGTSEFQGLAENAARQDIGLTILGIGLGLRHEVLNAMSHLQGGNAFSLRTLEEVGKFMEDQWPWFVSPIAYDLAMRLEIPEGFSLGAAYGFPRDDTDQHIGLDVATVFLSRNRGALLVRLDPVSTGDVPGFDMQSNLAYSTPAGQTITKQLDVSYSGSTQGQNQTWYQHMSVGRCIALAVLATAMSEAAETYGEHPETAVGIMTIASQRIREDATNLNDPGLGEEAELAASLLCLMQEGAPQGDLYGP